MAGAHREAGFAPRRSVYTSALVLASPCTQKNTQLGVQSRVRTCAVRCEVLDSIVKLRRRAGGEGFEVERNRLELPLAEKASRTEGRNRAWRMTASVPARGSLSQISPALALLALPLLLESFAILFRHGTSCNTTLAALAAGVSSSLPFGRANLFACDSVVQSSPHIQPCPFMPEYSR